MFLYQSLIYKQQSNRPLKPKLQKSITATSDTLLLREFKFIQSIIIGLKLMCIRKIIFEFATIMIVLIVSNI